ncbi:DUF3667 domain-containing protein [Cellulophaga sp. 20_2_10]|uniref:DUF3667 domain-containing protein n=1 Tax=Cellulophaga sp. 20_2_10 TaxID=2942476 RepID=UPI00201AAF1F|nr:DUF3667 domain-containing protein [Cellulophaga sp. 20_2_10]MCL5244270.1 DUF3667 domain-containing protein [Cellulophaga sp. 20_2_10]
MNEDLRDTAAHKSKLKRIDKDYLYNEIKGVFNLEKGLFLTIKNLLVRPGKSVREFLFENRKKYVKPIIFLILTSLFFSLIISLLDINLSFFNIDKIEGLKGKLRSKEIGDWSQNNLGYSQLIMGVFIAFWLKVFYRKMNYNLYEILILLSFVLGESFIIFGIFVFLAAILNSAVIGLIGTLIYFIYIIWAIGQFFGEHKFINYLKSFFAYALGNITYLMIMTLIAFLLKFL